MLLFSSRFDLIDRTQHAAKSLRHVRVGFGLQTVINNFVCGLILLFERPIKVGDIIQIDTDIGEVRRIGIRACIIRTTDGSEIIVPNGSIIANKVTNWTLSDRSGRLKYPSLWLEERLQNK
jgi:potassium efflux system protein